MHFGFIRQSGVSHAKTGQIKSEKEKMTKAQLFPPLKLAYWSGRAPTPHCGGYLAYSLQWQLLHMTLHGWRANRRSKSRLEFTREGRPGGLWSQKFGLLNLVMIKWAPLLTGGSSKLVCRQVLSKLSHSGHVTTPRRWTIVLPSKSCPAWPPPGELDFSSENIW